jgi:hypothetical protein
VIAAASVAVGGDATVVSPALAPAARIAVVALPATPTVVAPAPAVRRPWLPPMRVDAKARPLTPGSVASPVKGTEEPSVLAADVLPAAGPPQLVEGARRLATPSPALAPRIPNLLVSPRRAAQGSRYAGQPAAPITTPPVNNVQGTSTLPLLAPLKREIVVEIAPPAAPLPFDRAPYVQAPGADDDADAPATMAVDGVRARVD